MCALCNISLNWHHFFKGGSGGVGNQNMAHMGQYPQDGENGQNVAFFWSSAFTKLTFQTFLYCSEEILPWAF